MLAYKLCMSHLAISGNFSVSEMGYMPYFIVLLENTNTLSKVSERYVNTWRVDSQLIQPKEQNNVQKPPRRHNHAFKPPSGFCRGSKTPAAGCGFGEAPCSTSSSSSFSSFEDGVVSLIGTPVLESSSGVRLFSRTFFSLSIADNEEDGEESVVILEC